MKKTLLRKLLKDRTLGANKQENASKKELKRKGASKSKNK